MNETSSPSALRRRLWPGRSELRRSTDRAEAALLITVIAATLLLVPVALAVGSETYADQTRVGREQSRMRHPATATLIRDAPAQASIATGADMASGTSNVLARWTLPDGTERTGKVAAERGTRSGSLVSIWLDDAGNPVAEPITDEQAAMAGVAMAMGMWLTAAAGLGVLFVLTRAGLNRARSAAWQREWARVGPEWTGRLR